MEKEKLRNITFLSVVIFLSLLIRTVIANYRYLIGNHEIVYLAIAKNLLMGRGLSFDGVTPHLFFLPFYSFVSAFLFFCFKSLELASKLSYIFFGGLICLPLYYLASEIYNRRVAQLSALIMVFLPCWLLSKHFWGTSSEQIYAFLFIWGVLVLYLAIFNGRLLFFCLSSILFALSYLTREEGFAFLLVGVITISLAYFTPWYKHLFKIEFKRRVLSILVFLVTFIAVSSPYLVYLKINTGRYLLSPRQGFFLKNAKTRIVDKEYVELPDVLGVETKEYQTEIPKNLLKHLPKILIHNLYKEIKAFGHLGFFPFYLLPFAALGFFKYRWNSKHRYKQLFLFLFFLPTFLIVALFSVDTRYLMPPLPILIIWISSGISNFEEWLASTFANVRRINLPRPYKERGLLKQLPIVMIILSFLFIIAFMLIFKLGNTIEYKELGLWIKENLPPDAKIITREPMTSFYSQRKTIQYPSNLNIKALLKIAHENNAGYFAVDNINWISIGTPVKEFEYLLQTSKVPDYLKPMYENYKYGRKLILYEIQK